MANRVATCPRAKQIVGTKQWIGWAGFFSFPGFKGNWVYPVTYAGGVPTNSGPGSWTFSAAGGAMTGSAADFNAGDLVLREFEAVGPLTDYLTGLSQSYPKYWQVYICTAAITGSTTDPALDAAHFTPWDYQVFMVSGGTLHGDAGNAAGGPSGWPAQAGSIGGSGRALFTETTTSSNLELTMTTELANFPLMPATISGLTAALGTTNDSAPAWVNPTVPEAAAAGTFVYDWTFANNYDGTAATYTPPGTGPSAEQGPLVFPGLPYQRGVGFWPVLPGDGSIASVFAINPSPPAVYLPGLVSWTYGASSLQFEFAAWSWSESVEYSFALGHFGALATAPGTITQTITLGTAYSLSEVAAQAAALMGATPFDSIAWGTSWTNTYSPAGAVVSTQNFASTVANVITASCQIGTPVQILYGGSVAGQGAAVNGLFTSGVSWCYCSKALVDVCGNYCQRTYNCPTVTCVSGNVDGYDPVEIDPPGTPGESAAIYAGCQCT